MKKVLFALILFLPVIAQAQAGEQAVRTEIAAKIQTNNQRLNTSAKLREVLNSMVSLSTKSRSENGSLRYLFVQTFNQNYDQIGKDFVNLTYGSYTGNIAYDSLSSVIKLDSNKVYMISINFAAQATSNCTLQLKPDYNLQATNYSNPGIYQTYKAVNGISYTSLTFLHKPSVPTDLRFTVELELSDSAYVELAQNGFSAMIIEL